MRVECLGAVASLTFTVRQSIKLTISHRLS